MAKLALLDNTQTNTGAVKGATATPTATATKTTTTTSTTTPTTTSTDNSFGMVSWAIGIFVLILVIGGALFFVLSRRKRDQE